MNLEGRGELEVQISSPYCIRRKKCCPDCASSLSPQEQSAAVQAGGSYSEAQFTENIFIFKEA